MKRIFSILFCLLSVSVFSQNFKVVGPDTTTGRPGYLFTLKPQYLQSPLYAVNDSTAGSHAIDSLKRSPGTDSIYARKNGVFVFQYKDTIGTGGGSGWQTTGNTGIAAGVNFLGTINNASLQFRTNNTVGMTLDSNQRVGIGTTTPAVTFVTVSSVGNDSWRQYPSTGSSKNRGMDFFENSDIVNSGNLFMGVQYTTGWIHNTLTGSFIQASRNGSGVYKPLYIISIDSLNPAAAIPSIMCDRNTVGINTTTIAASAVLQVVSTTKGFLPPVMTTTQRNAVSSPAAGLSIYNSTNASLEWYNGSSWIGAGMVAGNPVTSAVAGSVFYGGAAGILKQSASLYFDESNGRLGVGNSSPQERLEVGGGGSGSTQEVIKINSGASGNCGTYYYQNGTIRGLFGLAGGTNSLITGSAVGDFNIRNSQKILFSANAGSTAAANINSTNKWRFGSATSATDVVEIEGNLALMTAGNKIKIATGSNASVGTSAAMTAGTITISTTAVTASSQIFLTHATVGGTQGILSVGTVTAGTSFVINSSNAADTGTVHWHIIN